MPEAGGDGNPAWGMPQAGLRCGLSDLGARGAAEMSLSMVQRTDNSTVTTKVLSKVAICPNIR